MISLDRLGVLERPDGDGRAGSDACGDRIRITLAIRRGQVADARVAADACPAALAAATWLASAARGRSIVGAARLGVEAALLGARIEPAQRACVAVAVDAFAFALGDALVRGATVAGASGRVAVGMSGGVDSAVAMAETVIAGADAIGITLQLAVDLHAPHADRACCAPAAVRQARDTCHALGAAHLTVDLAGRFEEAVVGPFVAGYARGETPNPCVTCNGGFRFDALDLLARRAGAASLATGHYARILEVDGVPLVARGIDATKDQSYMLARLAPTLLERVRFPLGGRTKAQTRERAAALGLGAADAPESQEICFLGGGDYRGFLARRGVERRAGPVEDEAGRRLGSHAGVAGFTPGQRRGIGVSAPEPLYVLRTDVDRNVVVVAPRRRLGTREVALTDVDVHVERERVEAKLRYRSPAVGARLSGDGRRRLLRLDRDAFAVAPGQTAAIYAGDAIIGVGTIAER